MKRRIICAAAAAAAVWFLTGCGQGLDFLYPLEVQTAARIASFDREMPRADTFAHDLCVVTGSEPSEDASVIAEAAGVFSCSDQEVIFQRHVFERMYPASITKVMTALVAIRRGDLNAPVTVGEEAVITESGASLCKIKPGDTLTLEQLLYGLMLPSGNDAGAAIAVHIAGSEEAFARMMNEEALAVGATDTHFVNPHGLHSDQHYTTVYDLYLIFQEALKEPVFRQIISTASYTAQYRDSTGAPVTQTWENSNKYISGERQMPDGLSALGGKTGTTQAAGYCLVMGSTDGENHDYISVVLKSDGRTNLYDSMTNIIQKIDN